jgi:hypothetical protein
LSNGGYFSSVPENEKAAGLGLQSEIPSPAGGITSDLAAAFAA